MIMREREIERSEFEIPVILVFSSMTVQRLPTFIFNVRQQSTPTCLRSKHYKLCRSKIQIFSFTKNGCQYRLLHCHTDFSRLLKFYNTIFLIVCALSTFDHRGLRMKTRLKYKYIGEKKALFFLHKPLFLDEGWVY